MDGDWHIYRIYATDVVDQDSPIWQNRDLSILTLVTCYPLDALTPGGPKRFAVQAEKNA
jgi:sortase A